MTTARNITRDRLLKNSGSILQNIYLAEVDDFTTIAAPPVLTPDTADYSHADLAAQAAEAAPAADEISYVLSNKKYYIYSGGSWVRVRPNVITDNHVFPTDRGFFKIEATRNKRGIEFTGPEDSDVTGFEGKVTFSAPGIDEEQGEFLRDSNLKSFIAIAELTTGKKIQLGSVNDPAILKMNSAGSGNEVLNYNGVEYSLISNVDSMTFYEGTMTLNTD